MTKLIQLKVSDEKVKKYDLLVKLLGIKGTFGEYQKAIDLSIDFTISAIKRDSEVLPDLEPDKLDLYVSSVTRIRKESKKVMAEEKRTEYS